MNIDGNAQPCARCTQDSSGLVRLFSTRFVTIDRRYLELSLQKQLARTDPMQHRSLVFESFSLDLARWILGN
jgi:hypothetical protein